MNRRLPLANVRFPITPLWRYVELRWHNNSPWRQAFSVAEMAMACGVSPRTVHRWHHNGLTWLHADDIATHLGAHPGEIWGYDAWHADTHPDREEAAR